jgi:hypothetical protein
MFRLLGTVTLFDGISAIMTYIIFRVVVHFDFRKDVTVSTILLDDSAIVLLSIARALLYGIWYCALRRNSILTFGVSTFASLLSLLVNI